MKAVTALTLCLFDDWRSTNTGSPNYTARGTNPACEANSSGSRTVAQPSILFGSHQSMMSSSTDVVLSLTVPLVGFYIDSIPGLRTNVGFLVGCGAECSRSTNWGVNLVVAGAQVSLPTRDRVCSNTLGGTNLIVCVSMTSLCSPNRSTTFL